MSVHRFPKWLLDRPFTIEHRPTLHLRFAVTLPRGFFPGDVTEYVGFGATVAEAAKCAHKHREARK